MKFVDAALDPKRSRGEREAALRFLAEELGPKSAVRAWARKELARGDLQPARDRQAGGEQCQRDDGQRATAAGDLRHRCDAGGLGSRAAELGELLLELRDASFDVELGIHAESELLEDSAG